MSTKIDSAATEDVMFNQILREAMGISNHAAEAFKAILTIGPLTHGEISAYSGLDYNATSNAIVELENERLVRRIAGIVDRFIPLPPYAGFVAFLKDFQKIVKAMSGNAVNIVDSVLTSVSQNCDEWKKQAQQAARTSVEQTTSEIDAYKANSSKIISDMLDKMSQDTELTKNMVTDAVKKHVDEHKSKSADVDNEVASEIDGASSKFETESTKFLKETTDQISSFAENYKGLLTTYVETLGMNLQSYATDVNENLTSIESEVRATQNKLEEKARTALVAMKTAGNEKLETQRKTFGDRYLELQAAIRETMDRFMKLGSSSLSKFKSSVGETMKDYFTEFNKVLTGFKEKTLASLSKWESKFKVDVIDSRQSLNKNALLLTDSLAHEGERLSSTLEEMSESFLSRVKSIFTESKARFDESYQGGLANLTGAMSAIRGTFEGVVSSHLSSCQLMESFVESATMTIIPSCTNGLQGGISEIEKGTASIMQKVSKKNDALSSALVQKAVSKVSATIPAFEKELNRVVERVLTPIIAVSMVEKPVKPTSKASSGTHKKTTVILGAKDQFREALRSFGKGIVEELKRYLSAEAHANHESFEEETTKIQSDISRVLSSSLRSAKAELGKGEVVATSLLPKFSEYTLMVTEFGRQVNGMMDAAIKQYAGESEIARNMLEDIFSKQGEALGNSSKQTSDRVAANKSMLTRDLGDLAKEVNSALDSSTTKNLDELDSHLKQARSNLQEFVTHAAKGCDSACSTAQSGISSHVSSVLGQSKELTESITNSLRGTLASFLSEYDGLSAKLQVELGALAAESTDGVKKSVEESAAAVSGSKETLTTRINEITGKARKEATETSNKQIMDITGTTSKTNTTLSKSTNTFLHSFKSEADGSKEKFHRLISAHLQDYEQTAFGSAGTCGYLLARSYEKHKEASMLNDKSIGDSLLAHRTRYEKATGAVNSNLASYIDKSEALMKSENKKMLSSFTETLEKLNKTSSSVEWVLQSAWMELEKTPQYRVGKTWPIVSKAAATVRIHDMIKRAKTQVIVMVPTLADAPIESIGRVKKAVRVTLLVGEKVGGEKEEQVLAELSKLGNVSMRATPDLIYLGCARDSEEILLAPATQKDNDFVGLASADDGYVELFERIIVPSLLGSSSDVKEPPKKKPDSVSATSPKRADLAQNQKT